MRKAICAMLALVTILSGCSKTAVTETTADPEITVPSQTETTAVGTTAQSSVPETSADPEPEKIGFDPHVHTRLMDEAVKDEWWDSFDNMCDAMRAGEDTFECVDEEAYKWCTDEGVIGNYFPAACTVVVAGGYKDGVGKLKYNMDKDKFLAREKAFEEEVAGILNDAVRSDYSEFEKIISIYEYMVTHFSYDYDDIDGMEIDDFSTYACLMSKKGICCEIASAYSYLLNQVGVDATEFGDITHAWTYVVCGGKGYFCDVTWGLQETEGVEYTMRYFMQTDEDRIADGFDKDEFKPSPLWVLRSDYDKSRFVVTDRTFEPLHNGVYKGLDRDRKVVLYTEDGVAKEFPYG